MARKRSLSDLLKAEAQKPTESDPPPAKRARQPAADPAAKPRRTAAKATAPATPTPTAAVAAEATAPDLTATVTALQQSLEQAQQQEQTLQSKIASLQSDLTEQKRLVKQLQTSVDKANQVQVELEKAQQAALHLAAANQKLIEENNTLKQAQKPIAATKPALQVQPQPAVTATEFRRQQAIALSHPVFPDAPSAPSGFPDMDIGWVD
jgi:predicted  nucleic acid-binding Zn-ribbon protein